MYEWNKAVQKMIDWIELNLTEKFTLLEMSKQIGYSPYYCSSRFHQIVGMTIKSYVAGRRLCSAAVEIRDSTERILDIALKYGFSSQQALTRAFVYAYRCTPVAYRKSPRPILISTKKDVLFPAYYDHEGESNMSKTILTKPNIRIEYIPAHNYIGIWDDEVQSYFPFWERHNCDEVCGMIESMNNCMHPVVTCHTAGWSWNNGKRGYCYGLGVPLDYAGIVPDGFEMREFPESYYLVFYHPPFDFLRDCEEVVNSVEQLAWNFDPATKGFKWNEHVCQDYQRLLPEDFGYEVLRPVCKL